MARALREIPFNNLTGTGITTSEEVISAISKVIKSGSYVLGEENKAFENEFAEYLGVSFVAGVASGTDALRLALQAVGCGSGDTVITVANAGGYATLAAMSIGCTVEFCDIDPETHLMDIDKLKPLLHSRVSAVVITHLYGNIVDFSSLLVDCKNLNIAIIEDCAQSLGGVFGGRKVGTSGDIATFSFYPTKNLGAAGDAGAICTNNPTYIENVISLRQYGWQEKYQVELPGGINSRLDEIQASILRVQLKKLDNLNSIRQSLIGNYSEFLGDSNIELITTSDSKCSPHLAIVKIPLTADRKLIRQELKDAGVATNIHYPILDFQQRGFGFNADYWTEKLEITIPSNSRIISLPLYAGLNQEDILYISTELKKATHAGY